LAEDDVEVNLVLLEAGLANEDERALQTASTKLVQLVPDYPYGHYFVGLFAAEAGQWEYAEAELLQAQALGVPATEVKAVMNSYNIAAQIQTTRFIKTAVLGFGGWLVGFAALYLLGGFLSNLTLKAVERPMIGTTFALTTAEKWLRTIYRGVIVITMTYFYISIPIIIVLTLAIAGGGAYLLWQVMMHAQRVSAKGVIVVLGIILTFIGIAFVVVRSA
jgi:hypothetical protein